MTRRILKWPVPVDDKPHLIGSGKVVLVEVQNRYPETVYVWTEERGDGEHEATADRAVQVYGTGHLLPQHAVHLGSVQYPLPDGPGQVVWHLYANPLYWQQEMQP